MTAAPQPLTPEAQHLADRLSEAILGSFDLFSVYLGVRLGYYRALTDQGPLTSTLLAAKTRTDERYTREWLEQQAVTGILTCDSPELPAMERRYALPAGYERVLIDWVSPSPMGAYAQCVAGVFRPLEQLVNAYRTGAGVPYEAYGDDLRIGQALTTRTHFANSLASRWFPAIPGLQARLQADPAARVADIGVGEGWSSIEIARGFPLARVDGFDLDAASVVQARANVLEVGLGERVTIQQRDAADPALAGQYDLVFAFECIHDMANPVAALSAMRRLAAPDGFVIVADEKPADHFHPDGDENERILYGFSLFHCLPVGRTEAGSAETGAVMRVETFTRYAIAAGFGSVEVLPVPSDGFRFYRLHP